MKLFVLSDHKNHDFERVEIGSSKEVQPRTQGN